MGYARRIRTDYRRCARCGCSLDVSEGMDWPGEGLVCDECGDELSREGTVPEGLEDIKGDVCLDEGQPAV